MRRFAVALSSCSLAIAALLGAAPALAQLPDCTGHDAAGASVEFEAGNALLTQAIDQASHRHLDRAHELATQALARFDRQCELGDTSALAERGAALLLLGEPFRSAESYDAYLAGHPLDSLDARTRRRIEPNLQPGTLDLEIQNARGRLFLNDVDFGALPRTTPVRVPFGDYRVEVRADDGSVLVTESASLTQESSRAEVPLFVPRPQTVVTTGPTTPEVTPPPRTPPIPEPAPRTDFFPFYIASAVATGVGLALGVGFVVGADERARTYNSVCAPAIAAGMAITGCESVLSERDTFLGVSIAGFVLGGIGLAGLVTSWILDANQPRARVRVAFGPTSVSIAGSF